ncbi:galactose mutarotase-like enzyme [Burkholderiales bacterium JOSHI_001]|nr:galactose mutarotase-like enzyme [Burkholderiales bacterium JOSHI_001]
MTTTPPTETGAPPTLELRSGDLRLALRPDLGGCIAGLWLGDVAVLRECPPAALTSARASGSFPLVPYSNRLGYRRFDWRGRHYSTQPNFDDNPHSVHGVAWQQPWSVEAQSAGKVVLEYTHPSNPDWPFAFHVAQSFELTPNALRVTLTATNIDARQGPMGLGWHPYFPKRSRSHIQLAVAQRWDSDAAGLPVGAVAQGAIAADVAALNFDHCFDGWQGAARIRDEALNLTLTSSLDRVVIYTPGDKPYYCVEPVSHVSDAFHLADPLAHGLVALDPGQTTSAWMQIDVARA